METISGEVYLGDLTKRTSVVIIDIFSEWCGPCKALSPILEEVQSLVDKSKVTIVKIDVSESAPTFVSEMGIRSVPTLLFYKDGVLTKNEVGFRSKDFLLNAIESML